MVKDTVVTDHEQDKDQRNIRWQEIDWKTVTQTVSQLQSRIVKAEKEGDSGKAQRLRSLLLHSFSARLVSVRRVVSNRGKRTPGIDGVVWNTPRAKMQAALNLCRKGYRAYPLRRIYIPKAGSQKGRALGIPTMKDRALQALYALALDPIAEIYADMNSYGFRKLRGTADAMAQCFNVFSSKYCPTWIWKVDIKGFYDNLDKDWLLEHIPMDRELLREWLEVGYIEKGKRYETEAGTPQGSIISPVISNMALDGLERLLKQQFGHCNSKLRRRYKVHFIRYADDFIITGISQEVLEQEVKPLVVRFLAERGWELSERKSRIIYRIDEGFDFLGFNIRKYKGKLLTKPSKTSITKIKRKIDDIIKANLSVSATRLIVLLNPVIRGWTNHFKHVVSKRIFNELQDYIRKRLWHWARRRHPKKSGRWVKNKYFTTVGGNHWVFSDRQGKTICNPAKVPIIRHVKIQQGCNPYDRDWEEYVEQRVQRLAKETMSRKAISLWMRQKGICPGCKGDLDGECQHIHHRVYRCHGGKDTLDNLWLMHDVCHRQLHAHFNETTDAGDLVEGSLMKA
jgi:RNA-directed DNA polymerase